MSRYWLNTTEKEPGVFQQQSESVWGGSAEALSARERGEPILSTDERTGIQALERAAPTKPLRPGQVEQRAFESIRQGPQALMAHRDVATGQRVSPSLGATRTQAAFVAHIGPTIALHPHAQWTIVLDQLNPHQSEGLLRLVAQLCRWPDELGLKDTSGILKSRASRAAFLSDPTHPIRLVYTPKHSSWLKQIESGFSTLVRRLLKPGCFTSLADLRQRLRDFITFFNRTAKPYQWTYKDRPWQA